MEEKEKHSNLIENICLIVNAIFTILFLLLGCLIYKIPMDKWVTYGAFTLLASFLIFITSKQEKLFDRFYAREEYDAKKYMILYILSLAIGVFCPCIPVAVWPYPVLFLLLSLFSNVLTGAVSATMCLLISVMLSTNGDLFIFMMYFLSGLAAIVFFRNLDQEYKIGYPIFLTELFLLLSIVLFSGYTLNFDASIILFASVNLVISFILLLMVLKYYSSTVMHRSRDKYMELNDPENALFAELKQKSRSEYLKSIHVAYFCERICTKLQMDPTVTKAAAYYHHIAKAKFEHVNWENTESICTEYGFPKEIQTVLKEFLDPATPIVQVETVILYLSQMIISTILYLFEMKPDKVIDYDEVITSVFKKLMMGEKLVKSQVSLKQIEIMRQLFIEEKLYYDFLRRE